MSRDRIQKFERMLKYQSNQVEMIKQQLAVQQALTNGLRAEHGQLQSELHGIQHGPGNGTPSVALCQQTDLAMIECQRKIKAKKFEIATADEKLDHLLHCYREEDRRLEAWEKLVDGETMKSNSAASLLQMQQADELFLLTRFAGEQR